MARTTESQENGKAGRKRVGKANNAHSNGVNGVEPIAKLSGKTQGEGILKRFFNRTLVPLLLMSIMPNFVMAIWYTAAHLKGSYWLLLEGFMGNGILGQLKMIWGSVNLASDLAITVIAGYALFALTLQVVLPGPRAEGPVTPKGHVPVYKDNGFYCYLVTMASLAGLEYYLNQQKLSVTIVYDNFGDIIGTLNIVSFLFCVFLYLKGRFSPSSAEHGTSGNPIFDYYWGTELYPRVFGVDIKVFTNCRFGMTIWPILVTIFAMKSYQTYGFVDSIWVSAALQITYFTKFFWWESGYMHTIDFMVDRAGFYICWGCLVYVPSFYALVSLYLVNQPVRLGLVLSLVILACGLSSIIINYLADWQKQVVRASDGQCLIWGKKPEVIRAKYSLEGGEQRESLLLVSGWWGVARHFHYIPELALALCWTLPALFTNLMPYSYVIFLTILLVHRTFRDDVKCSQKYKASWKEYCERVPYKMIPGIF